jgi:purine nucleosidase
VLKLHLDTDLGGDIDDLCALAMVLDWPDVELLAITTIADDQGKRAGYTRYTLESTGREDIPVAAGADISLNCYRSKPGLPDERRYWRNPYRLPRPHSIKLCLCLNTASKKAQS